MRYYHDEELKGHAMCFDNPLEMINEVEAAQTTCPSHFRVTQSNKKGGFSTDWSEEFRSFKHCRERLAVPWKEGKQRTEDIIEKIKQELPIPKSRRRRARWSEDRGELDIDRAWVGDPMMFRDVRRDITTGPANIVMLCNLDAIGTDKPGKIWMRSAAAIAVADILEDAGYSTEMHMWCRGDEVYASPSSEQFTTCPIKQAGEPVDRDTLIQSLAPWFLQVGVFGSFPCAKNAKQVGYGYPLYEIGEWVKYCDLDQNSHILNFPVVTTMDEAVVAGYDMLESISSGEYLTAD